MKGSLVKRKDRWDLYNISDGSKIASTAPNPFGKLSVINCESIEKGYSIEEIDTLFKKVPHIVQNEEDYWKCRAGFITGFQTAMELMGDKKFSEEDVYKVIELAQSKNFKCEANGIDKKCCCTNESHCQYKHFISESEIIQSLQQTEWDCIIFVDEKTNKPLLDSEGNLILKRK